jgi:hypothetical protein
MVRASCAEKLVASLEDDGDDLYFEGGRHRSAFFAVLGSMALRRDPRDGRRRGAFAGGHA